MNFLTDKLLIFLICISLNYADFLSLTSTVIIILSALTISCVQYAFPDKRISLLLILLYFLAALNYKTAFILFPLVVFDAFNYSEKRVNICVAVMIIISLFCYPDKVAIKLIICYLISFYLYYLTSQLNNCRKKIIVLKDTDTENKILAKEKNEIILKNQTAQIYTATLKERNRIAREIHDNVGHLLTRSILQLAALKTINKDEALTPHYVNLNETLNQAMTSIRNSVHDLHNESIDLKTAITDITKDITDFDVTLDYSINHGLSQDIKYEFLVIIKEALNNSVKYSNGNKITIILREHPAFYQLVIEDNGTGGSINYTNGIGLKNIAARVENLKGTIKINTDNCFRIFISVMK